MCSANAFITNIYSNLLLVSGLTIFIAGLGANFEYDLRRIFALSTLRQLGLMIMTVSVGLSGLVSSICSC